MCLTRNTSCRCDLSQSSFCLFQKKRAAQEGQHCEGDSHPRSRGMTVTSDGGSENPEYIFFSKLRNPSVCSLKLRMIPPNLALFFKTNILGEDEQGSTRYENLFSKLGGVSWARCPPIIPG